jgi:hypothetical protein
VYEEVVVLVSIESYLPRSRTRADVAVRRLRAFKKGNEGQYSSVLYIRERQEELHKV